MAVGNALFLAPALMGLPISWKYLAYCNILGAFLIAAHPVQMLIDRARPIYDQKDRRYHLQSLGLWWACALTLGVSIDTLEYFFSHGNADKGGALVATLSFLGLATIMTPLYLLSEWISARKAKRR